MGKTKQISINKMVTIAVDLMGGDDNPEVRLATLLSVLKSEPQIKFRIFASQNYLQSIAQEIEELDKHRINFIACGASVSMDESPFNALRKKRESSLSLVLKDVADKTADACVTAGNTGAMVALAKHWLEPLCDIEKPVLATLLPGKSRRSLLLDIGATIDARADDLYNFARLGSACQQVLNNIDNAEVALLNVGMESNKGDDTVKQADTMLRESELNYIGYCEGTHLFNGFADVICCNGFVGNITLKSCEAMASFVKNESSEPSQSSLWQKIKKGMRLIEPNKYNGALLLGLNGMVIKSHGACNAQSFTAALLQAYHMAQQPVINKLKQLLEKS
jgi:glycerol-3-phosphate acyltransferase PlsX